MGSLILALALVGADPEDGLAKKLLPIYVKEAETYSLAIESAPKKVLELKKEPVFEWVNPTRNTQQGVVFVWLRDGRPAALACIFSQPYHRLPGRLFIHELHALDSEQLLVTRTKGLTNEWMPKTGLQRKELTDAPVPGDTPVSRLVQMKNLAAEFTGHAVDGEKKSWDLRLLPKPLYRYPVAKTGVIDGALFALVSDAGTDPEVLLLVEAREVAGKMRWEYACGRFSDGTLHVKRKDKEVFASVLDETNTLNHGPQHLYRLYLEKVVNSEGKLLAWMRPKPNAPWGEAVPVEDK